MTGPRFRHVDSMSDGMCGYYEVEDKETGRREKVRWSVTNPQGITSQERARAEAVRRLEAAS